MSIWDKFRRQAASAPDETIKYAIVDAEVGIKDHKVHDIGALRFDGAYFHKASKQELRVFLKGSDYICGHNIVHHDAKYLFEEGRPRGILVDTLYLYPHGAQKAVAKLSAKMLERMTLWQYPTPTQLQGRYRAGRK